MGLSIDREKVIKGLDCCASMKGSACRECPYSSECIDYEAIYQTGTAHLAADALVLLKEQEPRVMTLDELKEIYVEFKGDNCPIRLTNFDLQKIVEYAVDGECRLWKGKPTDEQRKAVKWE